jgi:hypothetical protein
MWGGCIQNRTFHDLNLLLSPCEKLGYACLIVSHRGVSQYRYFDGVVGLAWSNDSESHAGDSVARQVKGDDPDGKGFPGSPCWGLGMGLTMPPHKNVLLRSF